ncbi:Phosphoglucosamine mutase [compost metagenome]
MDTLLASGKKLSELKTMMTKYPQVLVNVRVQDKSNYPNNTAIEAAISDVEGKLGSNGRVLVRPSGTEPLIRVMAEGPVKEELDLFVGQIVEVVQRELV